MITDYVETITMTKEDYDRNVEQLLLDKCKAELEIERLNNTIKGLDNTIENLEEVIKHKDSIIKEAIEYIEDNSDDMHTYISQAITQILKGSDSNVKD